MNIKDLEPKALWNNFADLNAVPRASKKEEQVIAFMLDFGKRLGLETHKDRIGNVIIKKPASKGMEGRKTIIMQSHLDMVHQKNEATNFDFATQGIDMWIDEDWVKAKGTTLGADNGIGVATIMAILESTDILHPAIEAMFTIDEETGMTGAKELDPGFYSGKILLNLDTEDDDELSIGCAGGIDTNTSYNYKSTKAPENTTWFTLGVKGLMGGHSGMDIHKGRGNANKLLNRVLHHLENNCSFFLAEFDGGSLRNAIPREAKALIAVNSDQESKFNETFLEITKMIEEEFNSIESKLQFYKEHAEPGTEILDAAEQRKIINLLYAVHNGVYRMSPDIDGLVEASSSLARVIVKNGVFTTQSLQRSSVESSKSDVANTIRSAFELMGAEVVQSGDYPGWQPNPSSEILNLMAEIYRKEYKEEPKILACHAGLECGILLQHLPDVDMVSFGPNIRAAHSPDEKVQISSVQKFWSYLLKTMEQIPMN